MCRSAVATTLQLVDGKGEFNVTGLEAFVRSVGLAKCGTSYAVVAIMGPQSSGKSTLLNHLFHTKFVEMDAFKGRTQTTQGVWLAKADGLFTPCTMVMDLEGTDGAERGESDDTLFERQSSLFALAVSDIVLINMWCHDIGREHAANKPLLKNVFQVMISMFTPRRTTLLLVIRDKSRTPFNILDTDLRKDIQKIWETVPKPAHHQHTPLSEFFNVQVTSLGSFERDEKQFEEDVAKLRVRFQNSITPGGLAGDRKDPVPGNGFTLNMQKIWDAIKHNKDLDLPKLMVMVSTVRCEEIAQQKLTGLESDEKWRTVEEEAKENVVCGFGIIVSDVIQKYLGEYDAEAAFFDEDIRTSKRDGLIDSVLKVLEPSYRAVIGHHRADALSRFKINLESESEEEFSNLMCRYKQEALDRFDAGCDDAKVEHSRWDPCKAKEKLSRDIDTHAQGKQTEKLAELKFYFEKDLERALEEPTAQAILVPGTTAQTWSGIHRLLRVEVQRILSRLSDAIVGFELPEEEAKTMKESLARYGRSIVVKRVKAEASRAGARMMERFEKKFGRDECNELRQWAKKNYKDDVRAIARVAKSSSLTLLSVLAAVRLNVQNDDDIESFLKPLVFVPEKILQKFGRYWENKTSPEEDRDSALRRLSRRKWDSVSDIDTLLTPLECKAIWTEFETATEKSISDAIAVQKTAKSATWAALGGIAIGMGLRALF